MNRDALRRAFMSGFNRGISAPELNIAEQFGEWIAVEKQCFGEGVAEQSQIDSNSLKMALLNEQKKASVDGKKSFSVSDPDSDDKAGFNPKKNMPGSFTLARGYSRRGIDAVIHDAVIEDNRINGRIEADLKGRFEDGESITTSVIQEVYCNVVYTRNTCYYIASWRGEGKKR